MKVLLIGGTGAMGLPLHRELLLRGHEVFVTSRSARQAPNVTFFLGNAKDTSFLAEVLGRHFDVVVDFMNYSTAEFSPRAATLLDHTAQYIFISSARVYAPSDIPLTEDSPRLLDVSTDAVYRASDEYALAKARQEDVLRRSGRVNWTIVRPSLTYNDDRLQYALGEKEDWLLRCLLGKGVVIPQNLGPVLTTMTFGGDVARAIALLAGNERAMGETVHLACNQAISWGRVHDCYDQVLLAQLGRKMKRVEVADWQVLARGLKRFYQLKYARAVNRCFLSQTLECLVGPFPFLPPEVGLKQCLMRFLDGNRTFRPVSWRAEACFNRLSGDSSKGVRFSFRDGLRYAVGRYTSRLIPRQVCRTLRFGSATSTHEKETL